MVHLHIRLPPRIEAAAAARHFLSALEPFTDEDVLDNTQLIVSELVTNSVRHAGLGEDDYISLTVDAEPDHVMGSVTDPGPGFSAGRPEPPHPESVGGWGLFIVKEVAQRWGVDHSGSATTVWFEVDAASLAHRSGGGNHDPGSLPALRPDAGPSPRHTRTRADAGTGPGRGR